MFKRVFKTTKQMTIITELSSTNRSVKFKQVTLFKFQGI